MNKRFVGYGAVTLAPLAGFVSYSGAEWRGSVHLHTLMETAASLLALVIGILALVRYFTKTDSLYLLIGMGFAGAGLLDGYHALITSEYMVPFMHSGQASLIHWSWTAGRTYLASMIVSSNTPLIGTGKRSSTTG